MDSFVVGICSSLDEKCLFTREGKLIYLILLMCFSVIAFIFNMIISSNIIEIVRKRKHKTFILSHRKKKMIKMLIN